MYDPVQTLQIKKGCPGWQGWSRITKINQTEKLPDVGKMPVSIACTAIRICSVIDPSHKVKRLLPCNTPISSGTPGVIKLWVLSCYTISVLQPHTTCKIVSYCATCINSKSRIGQRFSILELTILSCSNTISYSSGLVITQGLTGLGKGWALRGNRCDFVINLTTVYSNQDTSR